MNKYTELSDFEVNKKVAEKLGLAYEVTRYGVVTRMSNKEQWREFNPCNNPTDAMPIIIENKISLRSPTITDRWKAEFVDEYGNYVGYIRALNKNPLRACMEVFLMMKDAENEG
ncbi:MULTISPECIES: phage protein NinX family protein [Proteus]|uniref:phage protein NinX family protein n=2 Tax=Morganellaceae TaxID=1903414 RepID=UPI0011EBFE31|nr:phage protein NinX family protein [Proteus mirabilis]MBS3857656.1 DUF2591 domain-containing protein [Proteus mirabilis]MDF7161718.1 DUF2591 domain-containing protein [Proteus mirabilis]QEK49174.1 DUF2591 domain-containing protein [Proteus mirabilis]